MSVQFHHIWAPLNPKPQALKVHALFALDERTCRVAEPIQRLAARRALAGELFVSELSADIVVSGMRIRTNF